MIRISHTGRLFCIGSRIVCGIGKGSMFKGYSKINEIAFIKSEQKTKFYLMLLHMRQILKGLLMALLLLALVACGFTTPPIISKPGTTTTIILVRHAERDPGLDPPLNAEGLTRANRLAQALGENGVTAIYSTDYLRNRQTAEPLATRLGLTVGLIAVAELANTQALAAKLATEFLEKHAGGVVLLIGNVGSPILGQRGILEDMYRLFGGLESPPNRYQDLTIVVVPEAGKSAPHIIRTTYGGNSSLD
jgi:hypothetical protein